MPETYFQTALRNADEAQTSQVRRDELIEAMRERRQVYEEQQQEYRNRNDARAALGIDDLLKVFMPDQPQGPQPPMPGQPSVPMIGPPPGAPPMGAAPPSVGGMPAISPQMQALQARPPMQPGIPTPPPAAPPPGASMPPGGGAGPGAPPPQAAPGPAGAPPAPPMASPPPWMPMGMRPAAGGPTSGPAGQIAMPKAEDASAIMPRKLVDVGGLLKDWKKRGISGDQALRMLDELKPHMDSENKALLDQMKIEQGAQSAAVKGYIAYKRQAEQERHDREIEGQGKQRLAQGQQRININVGGSGSTQLTPEAKEQAARSYNATGKIPPMYKDHKSRVEIMNMAAELARKEGQSFADMPGKQQEFKAISAALSQNTKDLTAIGPYNEMLEMNGNIAIDLADKAIATDAKLANRSINWLRQNMSDNPDVAEFLAQTQIVSTEAARVLNNPRLVGQLTDSARHEMQSIINGDMPLESFKRVVRRMQADGRNRVTAMERKHKELVDKLSGGAQKKPDLPSKNAKGWILKTDKNGAQAYVSPDGKQFEEVK